MYGWLATISIIVGGLVLLPVFFFMFSNPVFYLILAISAFFALLGGAFIIYSGITGRD